MQDHVTLQGKIDDEMPFTASFNSTPWGATLNYAVGGLVKIGVSLQQRLLAVKVESLDGASHVVSLNFASTWPKTDQRPREVVLGEGWTGKGETVEGFSVGGSLDTGKTYTAVIRLVGDENNDGKVDADDLGIALGLLRHQDELARLLGNWG